MTAGPAAKQLTAREELSAAMGAAKRFPTTLGRRTKRKGFYFNSDSSEGRLFGCISGHPLQNILQQQCTKD